MQVRQRVPGSPVEIIVDKPDPKAEFLANRDLRAALEAKPEAARGLARDRMLWIVILLTLITALLLVPFLIWT